MGGFKTRKFTIYSLLILVVTIIIIVILYFLLSNSWDAIKENLTWIRELFTIIFVASATIIAVLTFIRARKTFLQPIRSEVIKKQSALLTELLEFISRGIGNIGEALNYSEIVRLNIYALLDEYGFILNLECYFTFI